MVELTGGETFCGRHPDGVQIASPRQILVYGCVPAACLIASFTIRQFCKLCKARNIQCTPFDSIRIWQILKRRQMMILSSDPSIYFCSLQLKLEREMWIVKLPSEQHSSAQSPWRMHGKRKSMMVPMPLETRGTRSNILSSWIRTFLALSSTV